MRPGKRLSRFYQNTAEVAANGEIIAQLSTAFSGSFVPAHPGETYPKGTVPGRPASTASTAGEQMAPGMAPGIASWPKLRPKTMRLER